MDDTNENISETCPKKVNSKLPRPIWRVDFDKFQFFPEIRTLKVGKETRRLSATPAALLDLLIRKQGQVILRKEIVEFAWPGTKEVLDASFYQVIKRLRDSLDDPVEPRTVITNPFKNAYALQPRATIHYKRTKQEIRRTRWAIASLIAVLTGSLITYALLPPPPKVAYYNAVDYQPVTTLKGQIRVAEMSPDSSVIVFSHKAPDSSVFKLMVKRMGTEEYSTLLLPNDSIDRREPAFSPSGRQLAWIASDLKKTKCSLMIADFNVDNLSITNEQVAFDCKKPYFGRTPQWKTESILLFSLWSLPSKPRNILELDLITGEQVTLTSSLGVGYGDYSLFYSRQANKMAYIRQSSLIGTGIDLRIYDFTTKQDESLKVYTHFLYTVSWADDQNILVNGRDGFEVVSLNGETFRIDSENIDLEHYSFSMGDNQIGFVKGMLHAKDINVIDLVNHTQSDRLSSVFHDFRPVMAKNSEEVVFVSMRNGKRQVFVTINQVTTQITDFTEKESIFDLAISPRGNEIAIAQNNQLSLLDTQGDVLFQSPYSSKGMAFAADGESFLYAITLEDGTLIKRVSLLDFTESTVTDGFMPKMDETGNLYFFRTLYNTKKPVLHKMTTQGSVTSLFEASFQLVNSNSFDIIGNKLYYVTKNKNKDKKKELVLVSEDLTTRKIKTITPITATKFSLNKDITKVVTTQQGVVQNNLASFRLVKEDLIETN